MLKFFLFTGSQKGGIKIKKKIFFVGYGGGHITMLIPVIQALRDLAEYELIVLGLTTSGSKLAQYGIPYIGYQELVDLKEDEEALEIGKRMVAELGQKAKIDEAESVAYLGLSYGDMIKRLGEDKAREEYEAKGRQAFLQLTIMERAFRRFQPDLVIATNSPRSEKAALLTARKMRIPAICVMDLFDPREFKDRIGKPGYADRVCVLSETVKENLKTFGRPEEEIVVTGNPAFDSLANPDLEVMAEQLRSRKGWTGDIMILWARQVNPNDWGLYEKVESYLYALLEKHPNWHLVIRPHPNDPTEFNNLPDRVSLSTQQDDLPTFLQASDVIITVNSTVGIQGVAIDKPLITVELGAASPFTPYGEMGFSIGIQDVNLLEKSILKALDGFKAPATLPKPGRATQAVVEVIREMLAV